MPACQFECGARSRRHAARAQLGAQLRVLDRARTVGDPLRIDDERSTDLCRAAPLAGVDRHPQAVRASGLERAGVCQRIRERLLEAGQVPGGQSLVDEPGRGLCQLHVPLRIVRAQRSRDQPHRDAGPCRRGVRAATDRRDPVRERQAARDVEQRAPADLDVADVVGGLRLDELRGDPLECLGVLHERDRQVERLEQLGL